MNTKFKLAAAAVLWGFASGASAAVLNTGAVLGVPGDVVLVAVDNDAGANFEQTFVADLELSFADLANGTPVNRTWNLLTDSQYSTAFAGFQGHSLSFYVTGGYMRWTMPT